MKDIKWNLSHEIRTNVHKYRVVVFLIRKLMQSPKCFFFFLRNLRGFNTVCELWVWWRLMRKCPGTPEAENSKSCWSRSIMWGTSSTLSSRQKAIVSIKRSYIICIVPCTRRNVSCCRATTWIGTTELVRIPWRVRGGVVEKAWIVTPGGIFLCLLCFFFAKTSRTFSFFYVKMYFIYLCIYFFSSLIKNSCWKLKVCLLVKNLNVCFVRYFSISHVL